MDIGTNSIPYIIAELNSKGGFLVLDEGAPITKLGDKVRQKGIIQSAGINRTIDAINLIVDKAGKAGVKKVFCSGTQVFRTAKNSSEVIRDIYKNCGLIVEILSGEEEARLAYLAQLAVSKKPSEEISVIDIGGGSTEFIYGIGEKVRYSVSLPLGAINITQEFFKNDPIMEDEYKTAEDFVREELEKVDVPVKSCEFTAIAGTATTLAAMKHKLKEYNSNKINGTDYSKTELMDTISILKSMTVCCRKDIAGLEPERADIILAGCLIISSILEIFSKEKFKISSYGVRHGLFFSKCGVPDHVG